MESGYKENVDNRMFTGVSSNAANKVLKRITGQDGFSCHGLRHTYVSYLIYNDINVVSIARIVGHKDATETLKTYAHIFEKKKIADFEQVRKLFGVDLGQAN